MGSMLAALGSYLQAKSQNGKWLVRIEDLDPPREVKGATKKILESLESHGLLWDEEIAYQSHHDDLYEHALSMLEEKSILYKCSCTRKQIQRTAPAGVMGSIYPGTCRNLMIDSSRAAIRVKSMNVDVTFFDNLQGKYSQNIRHEIGDTILKRSDRLYAYHLASVVDDNFQNMTEIVRGNDLIASTPFQIYLRNRLNLPVPDFLHLPIIVDEKKIKLSKQAHAEEINNTKAKINLFNLFEMLGQNPPSELQYETVENILLWGIKHWNLKPIENKKEIKVNYK